MLQLFSRKHKTANLVIKDYVIRHVELKQQSPLLVQKCHERYIPEGIVREGRVIERETFLSILDECMQEWGLTRKYIRFTVPDEKVVLRKLTIPQDIHDDEIQGYLFLEMGTSIHLPFEDPVFDFVVLSEGDTQKEILVFACPEEIVLELTELFDEVGLKPLAADISTLSLYRLFHQFYPQLENESVLIAQFDLENLNMSVFQRNFPLFMRNLFLADLEELWELKSTNGQKKIDWRADINLFREHFGEILKEMEHVMNFFRYSIDKNGIGVEKVLLCGDHPALQHIEMLLKEQFEVSVETVNIGNIQLIDGTKIDRAFYLPLGLALKRE